MTENFTKKYKKTKFLKKRFLMFFQNNFLLFDILAKIISVKKYQIN